MPTAAPRTESSRTELAYREADGLVVCLHLVRPENRLTVVVLDARTCETLEIPVEPGQSPMDVFHHPYAYAGPPLLAAAA